MFQNWHLTLDNQHIAWLTLDKKNASVNSLGKQVLEEFSSALSELSKNKEIKGLVISSAKKSGFIAGADISEFEHFKTSEEATQLIRRGQLILDQLEKMTIPTIALIRGFCLGGGLELALACRYRIVEDTQKTKLGLPEVMLGIHPGWGGSIRLPRLIGAPNALDMILSGKPISAKKALALGLVDEALPERHLLNAVQYYLKKKPSPHQASIFQSLSNQAWIRPLLGRVIERKLTQKIRADQYPAPYKALALWVKNGVDSEQAYIEEAMSLGQLIVTPTSHNLVHVFFLQEHLKALAKKIEHPIQHVHVIGAGTMGGDIAAWCAMKGLRVTLQDREAKFLSAAMGRAHSLYQKRLKDPRAIQAALDRFIPDVDGFGAKEADLIIEAIFESLEAKQELFKHLEQICQPHALLASNTSSIPLDEINRVMEDPSRLVGIHFFNPVSMMQLVEVVHGDKTSKASEERAMAFVKQIDRLPLPVKSSPGFLVNRALMPYLMEAVLLLQENIPAEVIDEAAVLFGMPMGPIELADTVGLDICLSVAKNLTHYFGGSIPRQLEEKVAAKELGKKTGKGFYEYRNGKRVTHKVQMNDYDLETIQDRLILRMLNETACCLREQVVNNLDEIDAGMVFGTGFAPFRGGPMHYAHAIGYKTVKHKLAHYQQTLGERFKPDPEWEALINSPEEERAVV